MSKIDLSSEFNSMRAAVREGRIVEKCAELIELHKSADISFGSYSLLDFLIDTSVDACESALSHGAVESTWKKDKIVPEMHCASGSNDPAYIRLLHRYGFSIETLDIDGNTPLHNAVQSKCVDTANELIILGANTDAKNKRGETPRELAGIYDVNDVQFPATSG